MKQIFGVLQAFLALLWGIPRVVTSRFFSFKSHYRVVTYADDGTPDIVWEGWATETVAAANGIEEIEKLKKQRVVLDKFVEGRWVTIADTHSD